jgi:hypothetical protein
VSGRRRFAQLATGTLALAAGAAVAWLDTRPSWDDAGVTAGALLLAALLAAVLGLRWWLAVVLVASPIVALEWRSAGWGILVALAFTGIGSGAGAALRSTRREQPTERTG